MNREGKTTTCTTTICKSEWHWAYDCPNNFKNRGYKENKKNEEEGKKEKIYISGITAEEEEEWGDIEAILDTGCKSTVCGEL